MPNTEWFNRWRAISEESGGSVKGDATTGGELAITLDGEVNFQVGDQGELLAIFPERGIVCAYFDDKKLAFVSIEVGTFLDNFSAEQMASMVHEGDDVLSMMDTLEQNRHNLFLTVFPKQGKVLLQLRDEFQEELVNKSAEDIDFNRGFLGMIGFGDFPELCYHAVRRGDEFVVALGETDGVRKTVVPLSFGDDVDYIEEICSGRSNRFQKLADKILLG